MTSMIRSRKKSVGSFRVFFATHESDNEEHVDGANTIDTDEI